MARSPRPIRPRSCGICSHPQRHLIELSRVSGASLDAVANRYGVSRDQVHRHCRAHVSDARRSEMLVGPAKMTALANAAADESQNWLDELRILKATLFSSYLAAVEAGDRHAVAALSKPLHAALETFGKAAGELRTLANVNLSVNIIATPEYLRLEAGMIDLARRHPSACDDIAKLLRSIDDPAARARPINGVPATIDGEVAARG